MAAAIDRNNRIHHIEQFHPTTEAERDFLCKIYKVDRKDLVSLSSERPKSHADAVKRFREIFNDESVHSVRAELREEGFKVLHDGDIYYAIDFHHHILINLNAEGFDLERVKWQPRKQQPPKLQTKAKSPVRIAPVPKIIKPQRLSAALNNTDVGSQSANREWEVGQKKDEEDVERGRGMKW